MRQLIDYLPPVMAEVPEMQGIMRGEQPYFDTVWGDLDMLLAELYVPSATGEGLKRWERLLKLSGSGGVEDRRKEILLRMMRRLPYTERMLRDYLRNALGEEASVDVLYDDYMVEIEYGGENEALLGSIYGELRQIIPANMGFTLRAMEEQKGNLYFGVILQVRDTDVI